MAKKFKHNLYIYENREGLICIYFDEGIAVNFTKEQMAALCELYNDMKKMQFPCTSACNEEGTKRFLHKEKNGFAWEFKVAEE